MRRDCIATALIIAAAALPMWAATVAYLGISAGAAPAYEHQFDRMLRESFNVTPGINMLDESTIRALENKIGSRDFPADSRTLVKRLNEFVEDSTVFVKGYILGYEIQPLRRHLIRSAIKGEMTIKFNIYSLKFKRYIFSGDIQCSTIQNKGWIFFGSAATLIHLSSAGREKVVQSLLREAVDRSTETVLAAVKAEDHRITMVEGSATPPPQEEKINPFDDLFELPSVEAPLIDNSENQSTTATDSSATTTAPTPRRP